jgi:hypothetical protein
MKCLLSTGSRSRNLHVLIHLILIQPYYKKGGGEKEKALNKHLQVAFPLGS